MKKIFTIIILFTINVILGFSQNFKLPEDISSMEAQILLKENTITFVGHNKYSMNYKLDHIEGLPFFDLEKPIPSDLLTGTINHEYNSTKFIFLCGKSLKENSIGYIHYYFIGNIQNYPFGYINCFETDDEKPVRIKYKASSELKEKDYIYSADNLYAENWREPWVESVSGYGIGEYVEIEDTAPYERKFDFLLIMNGYFDIDKPYLYKQNSRVKQIKVTGLKSGKEQILDVLDTPHPQTVDISFLDAQEPFRVTIMDVYKGTKYDDTCINCMEPWNEAVVPYENTIAD